MKINLENGKMYGESTKEEFNKGLEILAFFKNKNIDIITNIFKGKVENEVVQNLLDKMKSICEKNKNKDIYISWIEFMESLDKNNRRILEEGIHITISTIATVFN